MTSPELKCVFDKNDIICLTESWSCDDYDYTVENFMYYKLDRCKLYKKAYRNSGGVIIYLRNTLLINGDIKNNILFCSNDSHLWFKLSKCHFGFDKDLIVYLCYIVPSNSTRNAVVDRNVYDVILDDLVKIRSNYNEREICFMLLGDLNSRVGDLADFVHNDNVTLITQNLLPEDYTIDSPIPRKTQDLKTNANGLLLIDFLKQTGMRIANGRVLDDENKGAFTYIGPNGSSIVDYCIIDLMLFEYFTKFLIHGPNIISDHCLIEFSLKGVNVDEETHKPINNNAEYAKNGYKWKQEHKERFLDSISTNVFKENLHQLVQDLDNVSNSDHIDTSLSNFIESIDQTCKPFFW